MIEKYLSGDSEEFELINNKKEGKAVYYDKKGNIREYTYVNGLKEGKAVKYYKKGNREEYTYTNGIKERESIVYYTNEVAKEKNIDIKNKEIALEVDPYEEDEEKNGGFFGRIFSGLGMILSEKISDIDFKETLININDTLDKYKK